MALPTPEELFEYETTPARVAMALEGLTQTQLFSAPSADEWSIQEIVLHLADSETFASERVRRIIAEERPALQAYPEAVWAERLLYRQQDMRLALDWFTAQRHATAALLRLLSPAAWERVGVHSEQGDMTLFAVFTMYFKHGNGHLAQMEQVKHRLK